MSGDWIKMRPALLTSTKVNWIARQLESSVSVSAALSTGYSGHMSEIVTRDVMRYVTVSSLLVVWGAANEHTEDGIFTNADLSDIDDMVGVPGFGEAMAAVGWAVADEEAQTVTLPNFNEYNTSGRERSATAKSGAERQREYRSRKSSQESDVTRDVTCDVTRDRREEKRREEKDDTGAGASSPSEKQSGKKTSVTANDMTASLPGLSVEVANDFIAHRKAHRAVLTGSAWKSIVGEVSASGWEPDSALSEAMAAGWRGIKADWLMQRKAGSKASASVANSPFAGCE